MPRGRYWTDDEIQFLADNAGFLSNRQMAEKLKRSERAVKIIRNRRKLPAFYENVYTVSLVAEGLGKSIKGIKKYLWGGLLKASKADWYCKFGNKPWVFKEEDIVDFLKREHRRFNPDKMGNRFFSNIVREIKEREKIKVEIGGK